MTDASQSESNPSPRRGIAGTANSKAQFSAGLTPANIKALEERGIEFETVDRLCVTTSSAGAGNWIAIPYFDDGKQVGRKHRTLTGEKRFIQDKGSAQILYNVDCLRDGTLQHEPLIITEGECDTWAALQCGFPRTVSVPGGAPGDRIDGDSKKYAFLEKHEALLKSVHRIILAGDGDGNGLNLREDLALRLGAARCFYIEYPAADLDHDKCKDLNDVLRVWGADKLREVIGAARQMPIAGFYQMSELPELPPNPAFSTGIVGFDDHYKLRLGDFTVITGIPGHGKSSFILEVACRMAQQHDWRAVWGSFEAQPQTDIRRDLRSYHAEKLESAMTEQELDEADRWIENHFGFIVPDREQAPTLKWMLETSAQAILRMEAQILIFDPWNELEHTRPPDMNATEYVGWALQQFKQFLRKYRVHGLIASHPAKLSRTKDGKIPTPSLYDIADSAHWYNKADVGIVIHRPDVRNTETTLFFQKVKFRPIGRPGILTGHWNVERSRYTIANDTEEPSTQGSML